MKQNIVNIILFFQELMNNRCIEPMYLNLEFIDIICCMN